MGPIHFVKKLLPEYVLQKWTLFLAGPHIQAVQISCQLCSNLDIKDFWAHQILQMAHTNFKWPIKIWKFEWDMGHWSILRVFHHFTRIISGLSRYG